LAAYIRRFRERHGLSQAELARHLTAGQKNEVFVYTIQRWEYDHRALPPYLKLVLGDIARQLG